MRGVGGEKRRDGVLELNSTVVGARRERGVQDVDYEKGDEENF